MKFTGKGIETGDKGKHKEKHDKKKKV